MNTLSIPLIVLSLFTLCLGSLSASANKVVIIPLGSDTKVETVTYTENIFAGAFRPDFEAPGNWAAYVSDERFTPVIDSPQVSFGLVTRLDLPHGSTLQQLTCYMLDNDSNYNAMDQSHVDIYRRAPASTGKQSILYSPLDISTVGELEAISPRSTSSFAYPELDNNGYFYHIRFFMQISDNFNGYVAPPITSSISFYGCSVTYTLDVLTSD